MVGQVVEQETQVDEVVLSGLDRVGDDVVNANLEIRNGVTRQLINAEIGRYDVTRRSDAVSEPPRDGPTASSDV